MNRVVLLTLLILLGFSSVPRARAATADEWASRTIYQLLTDRFATASPAAPCSNLHHYCGGSFQGVVDHLDYIQSMGFDAIWISPIPVNTENGYHGYWALDLEKVNPYFGTEEDLLALVEACHARDMYVMLDVVMNHMGNLGSDYSEAVPFNSSEYYHDCTSCPASCNIEEYVCFNGQIEQCRLSGLPDLNQSHPQVGSYLIEWARNTVAQFGFDGLRLDTVPEVSREFWSDFQQQVGVYTVGEVWSDLNCTAAFQEVLDGVLSYPMCFTIRDCFQGPTAATTSSSSGGSGELAPLTELADQQAALSQSMRNVSLLGTFVDNHDNARFLNMTSVPLYRYQSALAYVLLSSGIPIVYYGTEQALHGGDDPNNRESLWTTGYSQEALLYQWLANVIAFRKTNQVWLYPHEPLLVDDSFYAFARGNAIVCLTNANTAFVTRTLSADKRFTDGTRLCDPTSFAPHCVVVENGQFQCDVLDGSPTLFAPVAAAAASSYSSYINHWK